jgi:hypothetical protein
MTKRLVVVGTTLLLAACTAAKPQPMPAPTAPGQPGHLSRSYERAVREYIGLGAGSYDATTSSLLTSLAGASLPVFEAKLGRRLSDDERTRFQAVWRRSFTETIPRAEFEDAMVPVIAKYLSEDDVNELLRFYHSPVGAKVLRVHAPLSADAAAAARAIFEARRSELQSRFTLELQKEFPEFAPPLQPAAPSGNKPSL